jgi:hypothetical protein
MESFAQIRTWVSTLTQLFGDPRPLIDPKPLHELHAQARYVELVKAMLPQFGIKHHLNIELVDSAGPANAPAWITFEKVSLFGLGLFPRTRRTLRMSKPFLAVAPFAVTVTAAAHELSHLALEALGHPLFQEEKAVDLTGMLFGYRGLWQCDFENELVVRCRLMTPDMDEPLEFPLVRKSAYRIAYLTDREIRYAKMLMQI